MDKKMNSDVFVYHISNKARFTRNTGDTMGLRFHHIEKIRTDKSVKILDYKRSLMALHNTQNTRISEELCNSTTYNLMWDDYYDNMQVASDLNGLYDEHNVVDLDYIESENKAQNRRDGWGC